MVFINLFLLKFRPASKNAEKDIPPGDDEGKNKLILHLSALISFINLIMFLM